MITKKELAELYSISRNTLTKRLNELGISTSKRLSPRQVELIYEELGEPKHLESLKQGERCA